MGFGGFPVLIRRRRGGSGGGGGGGGVWWRFWEGEDEREDARDERRQFWGINQIFVREDKIVIS